MLLSRFEYRAARTVQEALDLCAEQPGSRYLAGGTDLLPQLRGRRRVARVIDIKRIAELRTIREREDRGLTIGAAVPLGEIVTSRAVRERYPLLCDCCNAVGAYPLRNRATMTGNICNASPAADTAVALLALDALVVARGPAGTREIPLAGFFAGPGQTVLRPGEMVTAVVLPAATAHMRGSYQRLSRRRGMDLATVGVLVGRGHEGLQPRHRVALAAVAPTPVRVVAAEALLDRDPLGEVTRAAEAARAAARPITDVRGSAEYRREMVGVLVERAVKSLP
ncbi:MAG: xanthine dehydrogenase family protein subunit M [Deltaproteobacteria bacterium]|nr:xanthine dehydrogenase family protein subunit M [Deltaproteobacteria bacterium]